jgi:hypothetical protein
MAIDVAPLIPFAVSQISDHIEIKNEFIKGLTLYLIRHLIQLNFLKQIIIPNMISYHFSIHPSTPRYT